MSKLKMYRGDYREYTATVTDTYSAAARVQFAVKSCEDVAPADPTDSDALFTIDADSSNAIDNGDGTVTYTIIIDGTKTAGKQPGNYVAEIEYVDADGHHTTYDQIDFILLGDVNQRT